MTGKLVIVDYGMGNLHSVMAALDYLGVSPEVSGEPATVATADALILPGVGSFHKAMERLESSGLAEAIGEAVTLRRRKILGICLGQQLMAEHGEEDGARTGLGLIGGRVTRLSREGGRKVPHVGFNQVHYTGDSRLFAGIASGADFYFVHSYRLQVQDRPGLSALCDYGGDFVAAYEHENIFATQFHPEKSQTNGLVLFANFLKT